MSCFRISEIPLKFLLILIRHDKVMTEINDVNDKPGQDTS